jgi:ketosteroid isomerase-like protein
MFATVRRYQGKPGQTAETLRRVKSGLIPILSQQPGFRAYHAVEAANDVAVSVGIYDSRAAAVAANQAAASWVRQNLAGNVGPVDLTVGEVAASATRGPERQNVDLVKQTYAAFGRGDLPGLLALVDEEVAWTTPGPADLPTAGSRRGKAAVAEFFQTLAGIGDIIRFEPKEFIAQDDRVVVVGDETTRVKATGKTVDVRWVHVFDVRNQTIAAFEEIGDVTALVAEIRSAQARV